MLKSKSLVFLLAVLVSFGFIQANANDAKIYFYGIEFPWSAQNKAKIDTSKEDKLKLVDLLMLASGNASKYGKRYREAIPLFQTVRKLIERGGVTKGTLIAHSAFFSSEAEKQSITVSLEAYNDMVKLGLLDKEDAVNWYDSITYKCNRWNPKSVKKALKKSTTWMNG